MFQNGIFQWRKGAQAQISIAIAGDTGPAGDSINTVLTGKSEDILGPIQPALDRADLRLIQWETVITDKPAPIVKEGPKFIVPPGMENFIKAGNFDVALLANNHAGDQGPSGALNTIRYIEEAGIRTVGAGKNTADARKVLHLQKKGFRIAILNFCETEFGTSYEDQPGTNAMDELVNLQQTADERKNNDLVLVVIHGGNEYFPIPSPRMRKLYSAFARAGASAVVNIHTHCPQGIEIVDNVPVIYCPGNFFLPLLAKGNPFDPRNFWWSGYLPRITFDAEGAFEIEITPYIFSPGPWKIEPLQGKERQWYLDYVSRISELAVTACEDWFDIWCAYRYREQLSWVANAPVAALLNDISDANALVKLPAFRDMFTCQAHFETMCRILLLIERRRMQDCIAKLGDLNELQCARFRD